MRFGHKNTLVMVGVDAINSLQLHILISAVDSLKGDSCSNDHVESLREILLRAQAYLRFCGRDLDIKIPWLWLALMP